MKQDEVDRELTDENIELETDNEEDALEEEIIKETARIESITNMVSRIVPIILGLFIAIVFTTIYSNNISVSDIKRTKELCNYLNEMKSMEEIDSKTERRVYKLVKAGYWDNIRDYDEMFGLDETIYHYLTQLKDTDLLEKFLKDKSWKEDINADYAGTPIQYAVVYSNEDAVKLLLEYGADPLEVTHAKSEAYAIALQNKETEILELMQTYIGKSSYAREIRSTYERNGMLAITNNHMGLDVPFEEKEYKYENIVY